MLPDYLINKIIKLIHATSDHFMYSVIASEARQSHTMESISWRLPRFARNDGISDIL